MSVHSESLFPCVSCVTVQKIQQIQQFVIFLLWFTSIVCLSFFEIAALSICCVSKSYNCSWKYDVVKLVENLWANISLSRNSNNNNGFL